MSKTYLYRRGDGNEGDFPRYLVTLEDKDNPYAALRALVANDYIAGRRVRRHIVRTIEVDGDADYGLHAVVYEGPEGEQAFGAAWLTAQLEPLTDDDAAHYRDNCMHDTTLRNALDPAARRMYREECKKG